MIVSVGVNKISIIFESDHDFGLGIGFTGSIDTLHHAITGSIAIDRPILNNFRGYHVSIPITLFSTKKVDADEPNLVTRFFQITKVSKNQIVSNPKPVPGNVGLPLDNYAAIFPLDHPDVNIPDQNEFKSKFENSRTDELLLSRLGKEAFEKGSFEWGKNFFRQCKIIESSKVWMSNYPYSAGCYFMTDNNDSAIIILNEMFNQIGKPFTYLSHTTPIGFLISNLGDVRKTLKDEKQIAIIDKYLDAVLLKKENSN